MSQFWEKETLHREQVPPVGTAVCQAKPVWLKYSEK